MEDIIFQQDSQLGSEKFVLKERHLIVVGGVSGTTERVIRLSDISPEYEQIERRFRRFYLVPLFLSALSAAVAWKLSASEFPIVGITGAGISGFMAVIFLFFMKFTPIEAARFRDVRGDQLFEVYRPLKSAYRYDEFVSSLVGRIVAVKGQPS